MNKCNVCGRELVRQDELSIGVCAVCANETYEDMPPCGDCDPCLGGRPDQCALGPPANLTSKFHDGTMNFADYYPERRTAFLNEICSLAAIGAKWRKDSRLETWFPFTAEELKTLKARHAELYDLVEAYLCTPNTNPIIAEHYENLVAWFVRNKRPDGTEPRPVARQQDACPDCGRTDSHTHPTYL